ncbi:hypothetical protein P3342_007497 [Pyrenophora teres f. teres]|nr:hypothetical protein P3342_007497 [Pyrenophora teres f. teres]
MEDNLPNLNADELSAYASAKYLAGVPDDQIYQEIVQMLRNDGWKEAAIAPMINEVARRTKEAGEARESPQEPPKVPQDPTAAMMGQPSQAQQDNVSQMITQIMGLLGPMASRLEALEKQRTAELLSATPQVRTPARANTPPSHAPTPVPTKKSKFPHPEPFEGDRSKYLAFRYKAKAKLRHEYEEL